MLGVPGSARLPVGGLLALAMTGFIAILTETVPAGLLPQIAAGLQVSNALAGYARRLVPDRLQGRALALAMIGTPIALSLGVPIGAFVGSLLDWRYVFAILSALTLSLAVWVLLAMADAPGQGADRRVSIGRVLVTPGIRPVLFVIAAWMLAHNILYTYVAPFLSRAGLGARVDLVLLVFGLAALIGIWITGILVDRGLRALVIASLIGFALVSMALVVGGRLPLVIYPAVAVWGLTFGGAATQLGTASADAAGDGVDVAQAMVTTVWNLAIAGGGIVGGFLLTRFGAGSFPWAVLAAVSLALLATWQADRHGFPPGPRLRNGH